MENATVLIGQITPEALAALKAKHKTVFAITVEDAICYLRKPTRQELAAVSGLSQSDPFAFNERLLEACWLAGDERIKTEDEYFFSVCPHIGSLVETKHAELKKI